MIIDVDMGNTRLKWRLQGDTVIHACLDWSLAVGQWVALGVVSRLRVSSVVGRDVERQFSARVELELGVRPEFARVRDGVEGLQLAYADVSAFGVDRWLSMLAVRRLKPAAGWLVLGAGTALTADFIDRAGRHLGGYIVPGMQLQSKSLFENTSRLALVPSIVEKNWQPASTTLECVQGGLSAMYQSYLQAVWGQACELIDDPFLAWSGGGAVELAKLLPVNASFSRESLALDGLSIALQLNECE